VPIVASDARIGDQRERRGLVNADWQQQDLMAESSNWFEMT
jgi:hypothetical protein